MKRITLLMCALLAGVALQAQTTLLDQPFFVSPQNTVSGLPSGYFNSGSAGMYVADDFTLTASTDISSIKFTGFDGTSNLTNTLTDFKLYIYADASGVPAGDPSQAGTGVLELSLSPGDAGLTITPNSPPTGIVYFIEVDIATANGGTFNLPAGTYWVVAAPTLDNTVPVTDPNGDPNTPPDAFDGAWSWITTSTTNAAGADAMIIDSTPIFFQSATPWTAITTLDPSFKGFAMTIMGTVLGIEDQVLNQISLYPNPVQNQLTINLPNSIELQSATMFDLLGQQTNMNISENNTLNTSNLATGVYILKLETNQGTLTKKVIKQ